jgi:hypothetical protein
VPFAFPISGDFREKLHGDDTLVGVGAGMERERRTPGNYGRVWTVETGA